MSDIKLTACDDEIEVWSINGRTSIFMRDYWGEWTSVEPTREGIDELVAALLQVRNKTDGEAEKLLRSKVYV